MRVLLLWHSSLRQRADMSMSDADRAAYAMSAWLELDNVETCLDRHTCGIQSGYMMQMREVLFKYVQLSLSNGGASLVKLRHSQHADGRLERVQEVYTRSNNVGYRVAPLEILLGQYL